MKKYTALLALILLAYSGFSQSFREAILGADAIVVGRAIYLNNVDSVDYDMQRQAIMVHHYLKGAGADTLPLITNTWKILELEVVLPEGCTDIWKGYPVSLYCLKKYGDCYTELDYTRLDKLNSPKHTAAEELVSGLLAIYRLADEKERFDQATDWMIKCYCSELGGLDLSNNYSRFTSYYKAKGYISKPIDAFSSEQIERLSSCLQTKTSWGYGDSDVIELLKDYLPYDILEQRIVEYLVARSNERSISSWCVRDIGELLEVLNPSLIKPYTVNELENALDKCEQDFIQEFASMVYKQWQESKKR